MASAVLRGGEIIDGKGGPRYRAELWIRDGRIAGILGPGSPRPADEQVDVSGLVVAPGFIDMHAHSDLAVLADPQHSAKVAQGVTLEVVGQDGLGYSPVTDDVMAKTREQIAGWNGAPELDYAWRSIADYLDRVDRGAPVNVAVLVPHGTARMTVMGTDPRPASDDELLRIREIVALGLRDGAVGMSTGLTYTPGMYASDAEIVHALGAVRELGGYYCPHHRNYGVRVVEAYLECIDVARRAGVPLHLAHCNINFPQNKGRAHEVLDSIDAAIAEGLDISLDSYPYLAGNTYLAALLPSWVQSGGKLSTLKLLTDEVTREKIVTEMEVQGSDGHHGVPMEWENITVSSVGSARNDWAVGKSIARLASERGVACGDVFAELLFADDLRTGCLVFVGNEDNARAVMRHSVHTVGTDGILIGDRPHPRGWGAFPRFLGTYARELGLMSLEEAVCHATFRPARRLGLDDRGVIAPGNRADLVVFDPETIASPASYESPRLAPQGIAHVLLDGQWTLRDGVRTAALPGRAIRGKAARR